MPRFKKPEKLEKHYCVTLVNTIGWTETFVTDDLDRAVEYCENYIFKRAKETMCSVKEACFTARVEIYFDDMKDNE